MLHYTMTLSGSGGVLDSRTVTVAADDMDGLRLKLIQWLEADRTILTGGDVIRIDAVPSRKQG